MSLTLMPVTYSAVAATVSTGCHVLKLSGYSQAKLLVGTGRYLASARFEAAGHSWRIMVFPNCSREPCDPARCISLGLMLLDDDDDDESRDVHARVLFSFVRHGAKLTATPHGHGGRVTVQAAVFKNGRAHQGFRNFGKEELQEESGAFIKDDSILLRCDITVFHKAAPVEPPQRRPQHDLQLFYGCDIAGDGGRKVSSSGNKPQQSHLITPPPPPSASTIALTASTGCHVVRVSGYSRAKFLSRHGTPVESAEFEVAGHTWRIRCYPTGDGKEIAGYMSLYLELASEAATDVHARFRFSLLPQDKLTTDTPHGGATASTVFQRKHHYWGFMAFMSNTEVEAAGYLKDDSFFIRCDITVLNKPVLMRHDLEKLHLLCECKDHLCKNLHREAEASCSCMPSRHRLKKKLLGCLPI